MREIKFRAWDTESNIMVYSDKRNKKDWDCDYFFQQDDGGNMICYWDYDYDDSFGEPAHNCGELDNLMQYTGLKDKNGVEIYEGDIIKGKEWEHGNSHRHIGVVTYIGNAFRSVGINKYLGFHGSVDGSYEVIGNIYENPTLLEVVHED